MASIVCGCGKRVETQAEWAGQWITCPGCSGSLYAPFPGPKPSAPTLPDATSFEEFPVVPVAAPTRICPLCAETIPVADPKCKFCGGPSTPRPMPAPASPPSSGGDTTGIASLIVSLMGWLLCGLLWPIGWYLGSSHEADCRRRGVEPTTAGKVGKIVGMVGTALIVLVIGFFILALVFG